MPLLPVVGRRSRGARMSRATLYTLLWLGVALHLVPFYLLLVTSVKTPADAAAFPPSFLPHDVDFSAWKVVATIAGSLDVEDRFRVFQEPFYVYFFNSLVIAAGTLVLSLPITAGAAYANSKLQQGRWGRFTFLFFIGTIMVPFIVVLVPSFLLVRNFPFPVPNPPDIPGTDTPLPTLSLWDTPWAVILPAVFVPFSFLLFKGYFDTIPTSIIQAARVDGGSEFNIFRRIVLPMSVPVFAVAAYTSFASVWDNFLWQLLVLQSGERQTTSVAIYQLMNAFNRFGAENAGQSQSQSLQMQQIQDAGLSWGSLMVLGLLQTLPIFLTFVVCREYLLRGVRIKGMK